MNFDRKAIRRRLPAVAGPRNGGRRRNRWVADGPSLHPGARAHHPFIGTPVSAPHLTTAIGLRVIACLVQVAFMYNSLTYYIAGPSRVTLLFLMASEGATFIALMLSRLSRETDHGPAAVVMVTVAYSYPLLLNPGVGLKLIPEAMGAAVQISAIVWTIYAKFSLGRSFGLLPANRGVVAAGAYRWVRHPIYAGYLAIHVGFLAVNFGWQNLTVLSLLYVVQILRLLREEDLLRRSMQYRSYAEQVRFRLIPAVF